MVEARSVSCKASILLTLYYLSHHVLFPNNVALARRDTAKETFSSPHSHLERLGWVSVGAELSVHRSLNRIMQGCLFQGPRALQKCWFQALVMSEGARGCIQKAAALLSWIPSFHLLNKPRARFCAGGEGSGSTLLIWAESSFGTAWGS